MISISNYKILIFAAEPTQQSLSSVLGDQTLYFCQSLEQAQTALAETEIQLGFLDLDFNNDTLKLIEAIKSKNQNLPVAAMSKMNNIENIKKAMNSGFNDFLTTPLEENEIERSFSLLSKLYDNTQIVLQAQLDRFQEAKLNDLEMMATGIAHEINNPLAIILGHAMRIKRLANERVIDVGGVVSHVKDIESTLVRINKIVTGLRAFNSDSLKENFIETNISEIIKNTEMFYLEQIQQKGIKYTYFPPKQDILIKCLNVQLSQALLNLVNNAIHAIEDSPSPWIIVQIEVSEEALELSVINSGDKIPPKIAAHLFDPFYTTKDPDKGTGLGLSITKSIIEKHNGIIEYDDSGDNTRFNIYLPTETG